jgi:hypothetical protein
VPSFGLDGKMPEGDSGQKEMAMMLCSPNCKKATIPKPYTYTHNSETYTVNPNLETLNP